MNLQFGNSAIISSDTSIPLSQARQSVTLTLKNRKEGLYTVVVRDPSAPGGEYFHEVTINADADLVGEDVISYSPPEKVGHHYVYEVYEQPLAFDVHGDLGRQSFDWEGVKKDIGLRLVRSVTITTTADTDRRSVTERREEESSITPKRAAVLKAVSEHGFVLPGLSDRDTKYCRCVLHVAAKGGAYNPYAVCAHSTKGSVHSCSPYYDFEAMPLPELLAYAGQKGITVTDRSSRESAVLAIRDWKASEGK